MLAKLIYKMTPVQKVLFAATGVILGFIAVFALSFSNVKLHNDINSLKELSLEIEVDILSLRRHEKDFIARGDKKYLVTFKQRYKVLKSNLTDLKSILSRLEIQGIELKELSQHLQSYQDLFLLLAQKELKLQSKELQLSELEIQKLKTEIGISYNKGIHGSLRTSIHSTEDLLQQLKKLLALEYEVISKYSIYKTIILSIVAFLIFSYIVVLIMRDIGGTLVVFKNELADFFKYLNRDSSELKLLTENSGGTVGRISEDVNKYIKITQTQLHDNEEVLKKFIKVFDEVGHGDLSKRVNIKSHNPDFEALRDISNSMIENLEKNIQRTLHVLNHYADQDYRLDIDIQNLDKDFKQLAEGVNGLKEAVVVLIKENQGNANLLKTHSTGLSQHSKKLVNITDERNLIMKTRKKDFLDINEQIEKGNHSIKSMAESTSHLLTSVDEGLKLVDMADNSMTIIDNQAKEIKKTLEIIDEIALQTSILSLNASVEAVSAGEAGKGFAVVAKEVRILADKSTQAANQIKEIVQTTSDKIASGQDVTKRLTKEFDGLSKCIHTSTIYINDLSDNMHQQNIVLDNINNTMPRLQNNIANNIKVADETDKIVTDINSIVQTIVESTKKQVF